MRWIRVGMSVLVGLVIWGFAFLVSVPENVCDDAMPFSTTAGPRGYLADIEASRAPLPIPAARCTTTLPDIGIAATSWVIDWTATALASLGLALVVVALWILRIDADNAHRHDSPGRSPRG